MDHVFLKDGLVDYRCILDIGPASGSGNAVAETAVLHMHIHKRGQASQAAWGYRFSGSIEICKRKNRGHSEAYLV